MAGAGRWRYIAQRITGDGGLGNFLEFNLPLQGVSLEEVLSGHNGLSAVVTPEVARLKGLDGRPILEEWGSAIWAEDPDGAIRGGGIVTHCNFVGPEWSIECTDLTGASVGTPYGGADFWVNVDPMDLFRAIWRDLQAQRGGNLGISIDPTISPRRLGTDLIQTVDFDLEPDPTADGAPAPVPAPAAPNRYANNTQWRDAAVKAMKANGWNGDVVNDALVKWLNKDTAQSNGTWKGLTEKETTIKTRALEKVGPPPNPPLGLHQVAPTKVAEAPSATPDPDASDAPPVYEYDAYKLAWYKDHDLSSTIDDLASITPFDWHLTHAWGENDEIKHHIRLGYPRLGRRRDDLRFVVGENIRVLPALERDGVDYANEVLVLGAGEGSSIVVGRAWRSDTNRVRRVAVVSDPSIMDNAAAQARAETELARRFNIENITDLVLEDHPHAPMGSVDLGDEILVEGETGWVEFAVWCRVISRRMSPDNGNAMALTIIRSDRLA